MRILQDIVVPKAHDAKPSGLEPCGAFAIGSDCEPMLSAIHFDNELKTRAIEIDDVWSQWMLPSEGEAVELIASQRTPQSLLGVGHIAAEISCACGHILCAGKA